jgi:hypothetical protein
MPFLPKYSLGIGDRFGHQGPAQLDALILASRQGIEISPVWNKSHREHAITGSRPADVRAEARGAVEARRWTEPYFVDADHISLKTVDAFLPASDFFTLDVADWIGVDAGGEAVDRFIARQERLVGEHSLPGLDRPLEVSRPMLAAAARKFLAAVREAGRIYDRICRAKTGSAPVIELSMDETDRPQTLVELLCVLAALAEEEIPVQTIAPRFAGRFNKGVDYVGDVAEFRQQFAIRKFQLPGNLKLSVHSGSDKFALYRPMHEVLKKFDAGVHLKTAGTTWLEELIGLATAGGDGLQIAKDVYEAAWRRFDELCAPYASVIDIDRHGLPSPEVVTGWDGETFAAALRHDAACPAYSPDLRQLLHVGYKVAAEMGDRYTAALERHAAQIGPHVTRNLYERHIRPLFLGQ